MIPWRNGHQPETIENSPVRAKQRDRGDAALYAYHYVKKDHSVSLLWRLTHAQRHCPFDLNVGFLYGSLAITDVDSDGIGGSTVVYKLSSRRDLSPARLKLIMHEEATKYAIRRTTKLPNGYGGGEMVVDPALDNAHPALKAFPIEKWNQYVAEDQFDKS